MKSGEGDISEKVRVRLRVTERVRSLGRASRLGYCEVGISSLDEGTRQRDFGIAQQGSALISQSTQWTGYCQICLFFEVVEGLPLPMTKIH